MKKYLLFVITVVLFSQFLSAQILCINCYHRNDSISIGVHNLLLNGGFEQNTCIVNTNASTFCPNASYYSCDIANWTCTGGGANTYASIWNNVVTVVPQGSKTVYFGNNYCNACSSSANDTSCLTDVDCTVKGTPSGYPVSGSGYGGTTGISLKQTVSGLTPGNVYVLEFWTGGENISGFYTKRGVFAVDVGFGDTLLRCVGTQPSIGVGITYLIQFKASSSSHTIKFTNWGHICSYCTELILDNVRLYTAAELSPTVQPCGNSVLPPVAGLESSDSSLCENDCIRFTDLSSNATSWQWTFAGGLPPTSTDENPQNVCYTAAGTYDVTLVASNSGGSDSITVQNLINVKSAPPVPVISQTGTTLHCTTDPSYTSYQWFDSAAIIPGATDTFVVVSHSGNYNIQVTNTNNCKVAAGITIVLGIPKPIQDRGNDNILYISPNPAAEKLNIRTSVRGEMTLSVKNVIGQEVLPPTDLTPALYKGEGDAAVYIGNLPAGIYFLQIKSQNGSAVKKFVKE